MQQLDAYTNYLSRLSISPHTHRNYLLRVKQFLVWLETSGDAGDALSKPAARDFAVRDYKCFLLHSGSSANTVNAFLVAIDNFYLFVGLGPAKAKRQDLPKLAPRALDCDEQRRFLKCIEQSTILRNKAIAMLMLHCGLRVSEVHQLNISDVLLSARKKEIVVRCGKNNKRRVIPINRDAAEIVQEYLAQNRTLDSESPLFSSKKGSRLSTQAIDHLIRQLGVESGLHLSSHILRHTCLTRLVRAGVDIVTVAEVAGHSRIETTRRYSLPSQAVLIEAMDRLNHA